MAILADELLQMWASRGPAVTWASEWKEFEILVWADNIFLTTSSAAEGARRTREVANVFKKRKLLFNESSPEILPSRAAEKDRISIVLEDGKEFSWVHTLHVLGCFRMGRGPPRRSSEVVFCRGERWSTNSGPFCAANRFRKKNAVVGFAPRWWPACCGVLAAGLRR